MHARKTRKSLFTEVRSEPGPGWTEEDEGPESTGRGQSTRRRQERVLC